MTVTLLKIIACVTMLADHFAKVFCSYISSDMYTLLTCIGRIAFPVFLFLIINGWEKTSDKNKYFLRILVFALISQIPYSLCFRPDSGILSLPLNVLFTFSCVALSLWLVDSVMERGPGWLMPICLLPGLLSFIVKMDYGSVAVFATVLMYLSKNKWLKLGVLAAFMCLLYLGSNNPDYQIVIPRLISSLSGVLMLSFYNGNLGRKRVNKYLFYVFYPSHLLILWLLKNIVA